MWPRQSIARRTVVVGYTHRRALHRSHPRALEPLSESRKQLVTRFPTLLCPCAVALSELGTGRRLSTALFLSRVCATRFLGTVTDILHASVIFHVYWRRFGSCGSVRVAIGRFGAALLVVGKQDIASLW
jgi:hypothetical protein